MEHLLTRESTPCMYALVGKSLSGIVRKDDVGNTTIHLIARGFTPSLCALPSQGTRVMSPEDLSTAQCCEEAVFAYAKTSTVSS